VDGRRAAHPRFQGENLDTNLTLLARIEDFARGKGCTPAQLCLAWLLAQGEDVLPIVGTRKPARLAENLAALEVALSAAEAAAIADAIPAGAAAGTRYPAAQMKGVFL
jgi:aryl-alcohol dehydrogenase-like predicted oxidoreductase